MSVNLFPLRCSASKRWLTCPASVKLIHDTVPKGGDFSGAAAIRGTAIHKEAETTIQLHGLSKNKKIKFEYDETEYYYNYLARLFADLPEDQWTPESQVQLFRGLITGTVDFTAIKDDELHIIDLKTGNYPVQAKNNTQLTLYAAGKMQEYKYLPKKVHLTIVQTNKKSNIIRTWTQTPKDILTYMKFVAGVMQKIKEDDAYFAPEFGNCLFCPAKTSCTARIEQNDLKYIKLIEGQNDDE